MLTLCDLFLPLVWPIGNTRGIGSLKMNSNLKGVFPTSKIITYPTLGPAPISKIGVPNPCPIWWWWPCMSVALSLHFHGIHTDKHACVAVSVTLIKMNGESHGHLIIYSPRGAAPYDGINPLSPRSLSHIACFVISTFSHFIETIVSQYNMILTDGDLGWYHH